MAARKLGRIALQNCALFVCDIQEGFRKSIQYYPQIIEVSRRMLEGAKVLEMPIIVTEQYPKGLGPTVNELDVSGLPTFAKTKFSMCVPDVDEQLKEMKEVKSIILCGIETQACIQATSLDMMERGYEVHVIADAVSSRSMTDRMYALDRIKESGVFLTTGESMLLQLVGDAKHPKFKPIQKLIWDASPDSGLLSLKSEDGTTV